MRGTCTNFDIRVSLKLHVLAFVSNASLVITSPITSLGKRTDERSQGGFDANPDPGRNDYGMADKASCEAMDFGMKMHNILML